MYEKKTININKITIEKIPKNARKFQVTLRTNSTIRPMKYFSSLPNNGSQLYDF